MFPFFEKVILPLIQKLGIKVVVEIGALGGECTKHLLSYCKSIGGEMFVIDPCPDFDVQEFKRIYYKEFHMITDYSLLFLHHLRQYDAIIIDGDHNWYTVYNELKTVEDMALRTGKFPLVLLHDTQWPCGRRDLYYFPETIPSEFLHPHAMKGLERNRSELLEIGGLNNNVHNAMHEYGERNGVLTAIEDFLEQTSLNLSFHQLYSNYGLGIIVPKDEKVDAFITETLLSSGL